MLQRTSKPAAGPLATGVFVVALALAFGAPAAAQTFAGRVLDSFDESPVATALVRLVDAEGEQQAVAIADSAGTYQVVAPGPGVYRLEAARIGYENFETPMLEVARTDGTYPIDLVLTPEPVELAGFTVRVTNEEADREIRRMIGLTPRSLRYDPIRYDEIQEHAARSRSLVDVMRWRAHAGMVVTYRPEEGPCFDVRRGGCLPVYLNGMLILKDFVEAVPLDMVHSIVIVTPTDASVIYPRGAVLLYSEAWLR